jgi:hypothetical protein
MRSPTLLLTKQPLPPFSFHLQALALLLFFQTRNQEARTNRNAVKVVRDDTAIGGRVLPAKERVEDAPPAASVNLGAAALWSEC